MDENSGKTGLGKTAGAPTASPRAVRRVLIRKFHHVAATAFAHTLELLYPKCCAACGETLFSIAKNGKNDHSLVDDPASPAFCRSCRERLCPTASEICKRCGSPRSGVSMTAPENIDTKIPAGAAASTVIPAVALPVAICPHCRDSLFYFQRAVTLGAYDGMLRELVLDMKTDRRGLLAGASASLLGEIREKTLRESGIEVVVPVPMFFARRFWRGVNSPDLIAETLARRLGLPVFKRLMTRVKATRPQFRLTPRQRSRNLDGAFVLHGSSRKIAAAFDGKHVLLVDDILTTGSTCNAASRLLLDAGASAITVAVLARAVPPRK